jgi:two-component system phosphate regulon sensor histidine kinase PhoR
MLKIHVIPYADKQNLLLARDITQLHRLEQIRRHFVANASHELRTPLTVISGFVETMRDAKEDCLQHWQRPLLLIAQQTTQMCSIVDDLLLLSRLEAEPFINRVESVQVADMLQSICEEARILSGEQNHQITLEVADNLVIYGKSDELRSVFSNLLSNAVRYTPMNGSITVRWYKDDQGIHCQVSDTGEGIAPEHLPRLTERFYRVDVARSRNQGGTGLGLAIVKHVLIRHKGSLRIESVVGQGSSFYCDFPVSMSDPPQEEIASS